MLKIWEKYSYTLILIVAGLLLTTVLANGLKSDNKEYLTVTVKEGESLWKLAEKLSNEHNLTEYEFIAWVEKENGIKGGMIYPGEKLVVPVVPFKSDSLPTEVAGINIE